MQVKAFHISKFHGVSMAPTFWGVLFGVLFGVFFGVWLDYLATPQCASTTQRATRFVITHTSNSHTRKQKVTTMPGQEMQSVAVLGATGNVGEMIVNELIAAKFPTTILVESARTKDVHSILNNAISSY